MSDKKISSIWLAKMTASQLKDYKNKVSARQAQLLELKKDGEKWSDSLQSELDKLTLLLVDIDDMLEAAAKYKVPAGEEDMVHVMLVYGARFDSNTGKEISSPYLQKFTYNEWRLFQNNGLRLGYKVKEVLYNPYE